MSHYSDFGISDAQYHGMSEEVYNALDGTIFTPQFFGNFADQVTEFEGFRSYPYVPTGERKRVDRLTIGYGHTYIYGDHEDKSYGFSKGISHKDAIDILHRDLLNCMYLVQKELGFELVNKLYDYQQCALIDFVFNCGIGNFRKSTLLRKIKESANPKEICREFRRWNRSGGNVLSGLTKRCNWRCELWCHYYGEQF